MSEKSRRHRVEIRGGDVRQDAAAVRRQQDRQMLNRAAARIVKQAVHSEDGGSYVSLQQARPDGIGDLGRDLLDHPPQRDTRILIQFEERSFDEAA